MNRTKRRFLYIICIVISLLTPLIVSAFGACADGGSRVVTTVEELTDAIANASDGAVILVGDIAFKPMPGGMMAVTKSLTIKSGIGKRAVFTNATFAVSGSVSGASPTKVTFESIDFRGDRYGVPASEARPGDVSGELPAAMKTMCAAIFKLGADVTYKNCAFSGYHYAYGGVLNCIYTSDSASSTLHLTLEDCVFDGNISKYGGAVYIDGEDNVTLDAKRCAFSDGASSAGGAIWAKDAKIGLLDCVFTNNAHLPAEGISSSGGAIYLDGCDAVINGCLVSGNTAGDAGGGIYCVSHPFKALTMLNCTVSGNDAPRDGGICVTRGETNLDSSAVTHVYFSSIVDNANGSGAAGNENVSLYGCLLSDGGYDAPKEENNHCLTAEKGGGVYETKTDGHVSFKGDAEVPLPEPSYSASVSVFDGSIGKYKLGDNYESSLALIVKEDPYGANKMIFRYGDEVALGNPKRDGYEFLGWKMGSEIMPDGLVFLGGKVEDNGVKSEWKKALPEHSDPVPSDHTVVWIAAAVLAAAAAVIAVVLIVKKKKKIPSPDTAGIPTDVKNETNDWIDRVCSDEEITSLISKREADVLRGLLEGKKRETIASELFISENTVKKHSASIYSKLGVANRVELITKLSRK